MAQASVLEGQGRQKPSFTDGFQAEPSQHITTHISLKWSVGFHVSYTGGIVNAQTRSKGPGHKFLLFFYCIVTVLRHLLVVTNGMQLCVV